MIKKILSFVVLSGLLTLSQSMCSWAEAKYNIKEMTSEVEGALNSRRDRFEQLEALKAKGVVGENNQGYEEVLEKGQGAEELVDAENADRKVIYQTIAEQNDLKDQVKLIEQAFAEVQREKAAVGEKIQDEDGKWIIKK